MTKGKYAARAANARAESVSERADRLDALLANERHVHAQEVADLKTQIQRLTGRLTSEVNRLAADAVNAAKAEAERRILDERAQGKRRALAGLRVLNDHSARMSGEGWADLYEALGTTLAEHRVDIGDLGTRAHRRQTPAQFRKVALAEDAKAGKPTLSTERESVK